MPPDITQTPFFMDLPRHIEIALRTKDRFGATLFFIQTASDFSNENRELRLRQSAYCYSAAMTALSSTEDSFNLDAEDLGLQEVWKSSTTRASLKIEPLLAVLKELRNFSVHFEQVSHNQRPFTAIWGNEVRDLGERSYFRRVEWRELSRLRNFQQGKTNVTVEMLEWFNRQAESWPAGPLLAEALRRYAEKYAEFIELQKQQSLKVTRV